MPCTIPLSRLEENTGASPFCTAVQGVLIVILLASGVKVDAILGDLGGEAAAADTNGHYSRGCHLRRLLPRSSCTPSYGPLKSEGYRTGCGNLNRKCSESLSGSELERRICVAARNPATSVTISGDTDVIAEVKIIFDNEKKFTRILVDTSGSTIRLSGSLGIPAGMLRRSRKKSEDLLIICACLLYSHKRWTLLWPIKSLLILQMRTALVPFSVSCVTGARRQLTNAVYTTVEPGKE